jgi:hypothetical protein
MSLIEVGKLTEPATKLLQVIQDTGIGYFRPFQIKRIARAEAEAAIIKAQAEVDVSELQRRAVSRWLNEEERRQLNMEDITEGSLPLISDQARPEQIDKDWLTNFYAKGRDISDREMQWLWSQILAGEANAPGSFSKRTVNCISSITRKEALEFESFCRFCVNFADQVVPFIIKLSDPVFSRHGIDFGLLLRLEEIGLIRQQIRPFVLKNLPQQFRVTYGGSELVVKAPAQEEALETGHVFLTQVGWELFPLCKPEPVPEFFELVQTALAGRGYTLELN